MRRLLVLTSLAVLAGACLGSDFEDSLQGSWQLTSGTVDGEEIAMIDGYPITITFDEDRVGGTAACNSYGGTFSLSGSEITVSDLSMTEMGCFPEEIMQAEAMYAGAITRVGKVSLDEELTLSGDGVELAFEALEPVPDAGLTNTVWVLDGLVRGDSVSTPVMDTQATVEFFTDQSIVGDTGSRPFAGRYTISGAEVLVTELASDGHQCEPDLADQDNLVLSVLGDGFRVDIEGDRLHLSGQENQGLVFVAAS